MTLYNATDADHWEYVGEGNLNLVVRYIGDNDLYIGKVLRITKKDNNASHASHNFKQQFHDKVIKPLLGDNYVVHMIAISTAADFLQQLAHNVEPHRPSFRLNKQINTESCTSFLLPDLTCISSELPRWTFELKPKWGFKPMSPFISSRNYAMKQRYCRFCMHSRLRGLKENGFCPLDLYSMDRSRIRRALHVLLKDGEMQKTLKVTIDGKIIPLDSPEQQKGAILYRFRKDDTLLQDILENILIQDPILQVLKQLQMQLDELDVEGIYSIYKNNEQLQHLVTDDIEVWEQVVALFTKRRQQQQQKSKVSSSSSSSIVLDDEEEQRQKIYEYILSMTFKDCSLMINVKHATSTNAPNVIQLQDRSSFQYDIKVIDTDLKNIGKIPYWFDLDQSIVHHAIETNV